MNVQYFLLLILGDVEIEKRGPFAHEQGRDVAAKFHRKAHGESDGIFWMNVTTGLDDDWADRREYSEPEVNVRVEVGDYPGAFFEG